MQRAKSTSAAPTPPTKVPSPGAVSAVGPRPPKLAAPRIKPGAASTRMYGKADTSAPPASEVNPFTGRVGGM